MLKLFEEQNVSLYQIQKDLGLERKRLYRYAERKVDIKNMPHDLIIKLSYYFHIEINQMYEKMVDYLGGK